MAENRLLARAARNQSHVITATYRAATARERCYIDLFQQSARLRSGRRRRGQAAIEYALVWSGIVMPLTAIIIFTSQMLWVWHSAIEFTREGARYAVTHCYQGNGENVRAHMRANVPKMVDQDQFSGGAAEIEVAYFQRNPESGALEEFSCSGAECSRECVPDVVSVRINNYQFRALFSYFGLPPVSLPNFSTTLPMESAGCSPDSQDCLP